MGYEEIKIAVKHGGKPQGVGIIWGYTNTSKFYGKILIGFGEEYYAEGSSISDVSKKLEDIARQKSENDLTEICGITIGLLE